MELEVGDDIGSFIGSIFGQGVKGVKYGFIVWFGISVGWGVDRGVGAGNVSADGLTFEVYDGYNMGYSDGFFDDFSVGNSRHTSWWITRIK